MEMNDRKIVRSVNAGVFFGTIVSLDGQTVEMTDARRIWFWDGAASLSELAVRGTRKPDQCKFPVTVPHVTVFEVCEILDVTDAAAASLDSVPEWRA